MKKSKNFEIKFEFNSWRYRWWANGFCILVQCLERYDCIVICSISDVIRNWDNEGPDQSQTSFAKWNSAKCPNLCRLQWMASCWNVLSQTSLASCPPTWVNKTVVCPNFDCPKKSLRKSWKWFNASTMVEIKNNFSAHWWLSLYDPGSRRLFPLVHKSKINSNQTWFWHRQQC